MNRDYEARQMFKEVAETARAFAGLSDSEKKALMLIVGGYAKLSGNKAVVYNGGVGYAIVMTRSRIKLIYSPSNSASEDQEKIFHAPDAIEICSEKL